MVSKSKVQAGVLEDRISALPDSIICHILSFFQTKYAVRTSILSKRWKKMWASVPNLNFDDEDFSDFIAFSMFVERALFFRDSSDIRKFSLDCICPRNPHIGDFPHIDGWIRTAIRRNPVELDLCVLKSGGQIFELPKSLFMCKTLKVLKLTSNFITNTPSSGCFPSLKLLHVTVHKPDKRSMEKLFSCCPVLEDLRIVGFLQDDVVLNINISAPELKSLRIRFCRCDHPYYQEHNFFINAPNLENFNLHPNALSNYFWENAKSLARATIGFDGHFVEDKTAFGNHTATLLAGISNVRYLSLSIHFLEASRLPAFDNLSKLKLVVHNCCYWWPEFLKRSQNLKDLVLEVGNKCNEESPDEEYSDEEHSEDTWNPPEFVPICLLSQLKSINIRGFRGRHDEMEAAKYFLKNGEVLDKMTISSRKIYGFMYTEKELYKEFLMFPRGSKTCKVDFI